MYLQICRPPYTSCKTPQMKAEIAGSRYAIIGDEKEEESMGLQGELCFFQTVINTRTRSRDSIDAKDPKTPPKSSLQKVAGNDVAQQRNHHHTTHAQESQGQHKSG